MKAFATLIGAMGWVREHAKGPVTVLITVPPKKFKGEWRTVRYDLDPKDCL